MQRPGLVKVTDLLYSDPQCLEITIQDRLTITTGGSGCFRDPIRLFLCVSTQGPSSKWHTVVLPGAISRLCSVSARQIPVWDTDTPPYLSKTPTAQSAARKIHRSAFSSPSKRKVVLWFLFYKQKLNDLIFKKVKNRSDNRYVIITVKINNKPKASRCRLPHKNEKLHQRIHVVFTSTSTLKHHHNWQMTWSITFNKIKLHSICLSMRNQFTWLHKQNWFHVHGFP